MFYYIYNNEDFYIHPEDPFRKTYNTHKVERHTNHGKDECYRSHMHAFFFFKTYLKDSCF